MRPSAVESCPRRRTFWDRGIREGSSRLPLGEERANILLLACCYQEGSNPGPSVLGPWSPVPKCDAPRAPISVEEHTSMASRPRRQSQNPPLQNLPPFRYDPSLQNHV